MEDQRNHQDASAHITRNAERRSSGFFLAVRTIDRSTPALDHVCHVEDVNSAITFGAVFVHFLG